MLGQSTIYRPRFWARLFLSTKWKLTLAKSNLKQVQLDSSDSAKLLCQDITSITTNKDLIWHSVEIRSKDRVDKLSGLNVEKAQKLCEDLRQFINQFLADKIEKNKKDLIHVDAVILELTQDSQKYLAQADLSQAISGIDGDVANAMAHPLFDIAFIPMPLARLFPESFRMMTDTATRHRYNENFISTELVRYKNFFNNLDSISLSDEQREACIRIEDNNLLVASAGSGKTATMVGKIAYVLDKKLYSQDEILTLAFNSDAASELRKRIAHQQGVEESELKCQVSTFHALGRGIIEDVEGSPPQLANWAEHASGEALLIEGMIQELMQSDTEFFNLWTELLVLYPKADIAVDSFDSKEDYQRYIMDRAQSKGGTVSTLSKVFVKSLQEQTIANWLWMNSVPFEYEKQFAYDESDGNRRFVHPDFYYPKTQTLHEHFAINANGTSPFADYVKHAEAKRQGYNRAGYDFFETTSAMANDDQLIATLRGELIKRGQHFNPKSFDEIQDALSSTVIKRYHKLVGVCIKHIRSSHLTLEMLLERAKGLQHPVRAKKFAKALWIITESYQQKLDETEKIDFESMIGDAIKHIESRRYRSPYSLILVDEFQDISEPRARLIKALKHQKVFSKVFAVGDDWQSIYRFAGSDITIFTKFRDHFGTSWQGRLERTYRCNQLIAETAANFIQRNPEQLKKEVQSQTKNIPHSIRVIPVEVEWHKPSFSKACNSVLERINSFAEKVAAKWQSHSSHRLKVLVLSRYNMTNPYKNKLPVFSHIEVNSLTFHRSKGMEADYTLLLDVSEGNYGVPSRIEDDELLNLVIPRPESHPYAEERRLFYVALTRASRGVFILSNQRRPSRYIAELQEIAGSNIIFENVDGSPIQMCPSCRKGYFVKRKAGDGSKFLGCSQYPLCKKTSPLVKGGGGEYLQ